MATCGNLWQLVAAFGNFWQLWAIFGNFWQPLAAFGTPWQLLATFGNFWQLLATFGNCCQFLATYRNFWQLLATYRNNSTANGPIREILKAEPHYFAKILPKFHPKNFNETQPKSTMSNLIMPVIHKQKKGTFMQDRYMQARSKKFLILSFN